MGKEEINWKLNQAHLMMEIDKGTFKNSFVLSCCCHIQWVLQFPYC